MMPACRNMRIYCFMLQIATKLRICMISLKIALKEAIDSLYITLYQVQECDKYPGAGHISYITLGCGVGNRRIATTAEGVVIPST